MTRPLILLTFLLGLLAPLGSAPATAAARAPITGRVVDMHGSPVAGVEVTLFRVGSAMADNSGAMTGADGRFLLQPKYFHKKATFNVLISTGRWASTAIPTWYDGSGADGGIRASVIGTDVTTQFVTTAAAAPAGAAPVKFSANAQDLGDLATAQGARVRFDGKDTNGNGVAARVVAHDAVSNTVREAWAGTNGYLLEPGQQTATLIASPYLPEGRQQVALDLAAGTTSTVPVTWAARYYPGRIDRGLEGGAGVLEVAGQRLSVGDKLWADTWFSNDPRLTDPTTSYQWYRDGAPIPGATTRTYKVVKADRGHQVGYLVTVAAQQGYLAATFASTPDTVAKVTAKVKATFPRGDISIAHPERFRIRVQVSQSNKKHPVGRLALIVLNQEPEIPAKVIVGTKVRRSGRTTFVMHLPKKFDAWAYDEYGSMYVRFVPKNRAKVSVAGSNGRSIYTY